MFHIEMRSRNTIIIITISVIRDVRSVSWSVTVCLSVSPFLRQFVDVVVIVVVVVALSLSHSTLKLCHPVTTQTLSLCRTAFRVPTVKSLV